MDQASDSSQRRTFMKMAPEIRRQQLIDATFRCLCRDGVSQTSVRTIAQEAGLSLGMVRHLFNSKDELLAETYRHLSTQLQEHTLQVLSRADPAPMAQLQALITAGFQPSILNRDYVRMRFLFWELSHTNESVRRVHDEIYKRFERQLHGLVTKVAKQNGADVDCDTLTLAIAALLKGVWLEWSLSDEKIDPSKLVQHILPALQRKLR